MAKWKSDPEKARQPATKQQLFIAMNYMRAINLIQLAVMREIAGGNVKNALELLNKAEETDTTLDLYLDEMIANKLVEEEGE